jgi:hypothetical protein
MSLEVKHMVVKTDVVCRSAQDERGEPSPLRQLEASEMHRILDACRRMVRDMLSERWER